MKSSTRRITVGIAATALTVGLGAAGVAFAGEKPASPVRLVIGLKAGNNATGDLPSLVRLGIAGAAARRGGEVRGSLLAEVGAKSLEVPAGRSASIIASLRNDPSVAYVQVDPVAKAFAVAPNDPIYSGGHQPELAQLKVPAAWNVTSGSAVKVAVIDTGVSAVGDLAGKVLPGYDFVNGDSNARDDGAFPHGTVVSSLIAAKTNNSAGLAGVCAQCKILPVKVLDSEGSGDYSTVAAGVIYAAKQGAQIINLSLGGPSSAPVLQDAIAYAVGKGALVVAAAGNEGTSAKQYPAAYADVLSVGATNTRTGGTARAGFSSYGNTWVDVAAPGITAGMLNDGSYCWDGSTDNCFDWFYNEYEVQGTSFSAPLVSGVAALIKSKHPRYSGWGLQNAITSSSRKIGSWVKYGLVDASAALTKGTDLVPPTATGTTPGQNKKVRGTVAVAPTGLKDNWSGIRNVDLYLNGKWHSWDYVAPFAPKLKTAGRNGALKVELRVTDRAGNTRRLGVRTLIADNVAPAVTVTKAPKNKAKVKGTVTWKVKASDKSGISKAQLIVNNKVVATDTKSAYSLSFKVAKQKKTMKVRVRVYDKVGNVKYTAIRTYYRA